MDSPGMTLPAQQPLRIQLKRAHISVKIMQMVNTSNTSAGFRLVSFAPR